MEPRSAASPDDFRYTGVFPRSARVPHMASRFYSEHPIVSDDVQLAGQEHHHMAKVMRMKAGDEIVLFDGSGYEFTAIIDLLGRNAARCRVTDKRAVDRELPFSLSLAVALPKGDRQQWLVEKAVELGVSTLIPLVTQHGVAQPRDKSLARLERWVVAASKQCGRNKLMHIAAPEKLADISRADLQSENGQAWFAHPGQSTAIADLLTSSPQAPSIVAIGPEGGFADEELEEAIELGYVAMSLGDRILRIETAAIALVSAIVFAKG